MKVSEVKNKYGRIKGGWIATSLLCIVFGLILAIWPGIAANTANFVLGGIVLVVGIIYLAFCFWTKQKNVLTGFGIVFSVILMAIGIFMLVKPEVVFAIFPMIVGGIILIHGVLDLRNSIGLAVSKYNYWWVALIIAIVTIGLGVLLLFNPFTAVELAFRIIGIILIVDGISDFWIGFQVKKVAPNVEAIGDKKEIIEVSAKEK